MKKYTDMLGSTKAARHAADIVAALTPPPRSDAELAGQASALVPAEKSPPVGESVKALAPSVVGIALGAYLWRNHRFLGALTGLAIGSNVLPLYHARNSKQERTNILSRMGTELAAVAGGVIGNKVWKSHPNWGAVAGAVAGLTAGLVASTFIPGTALNAEYYRQKEEWTGKKKGQ